MLQQHVDSGADVTVGCLEVPRMEATGFGVMHVDDKDRIISFLEKPKDPPAMPDNPDMALASMGIYVFDAEFLFEQLRRDAADTEFEPRFRQGRDPLHRQERQGGGASFRPVVRALARRADAYWRDVGTVDAYWEANIDLTEVVPALDLYDNSWPIWTYAELTAPAKFVHDVEGRRGFAVSSLVSGGCIVSGATLRRSLLFTGVRVNSFSTIEEACILPYVNVGRSVRLKRVIVDRGVQIPEGPGGRRGPGTRRQALPPHRQAASA